MANAYRYASGDAGSASSVASQAAFDAAPLDEHDADAAAAGADDDEAIALLELVERDDAAVLYEGPNIALAKARAPGDEPIEEK